MVQEQSMLTYGIDVMIRGYHVRTTHAQLSHKILAKKRRVPAKRRGEFSIKVGGFLAD